ncbi:MAG: ABC transporter permease [Candidatus Borkfalkiaceae bacterium]|nr:ABC transporter permease [Clostridia bacterium]MDY6223946.1 ABC transporter permease [Christensenellaceae bacterium]
MKTILTIIKKEFFRVFKDRRLLLSLILPGVLIYCIYSVMGDAIGNLSQPDETQTYKVAVIDLPDSFQTTFSSAPNVSVQAQENNEEAVEQAKKQINEGSLDLLLVFPAEFNEDTLSSAPQQITAYYSEAEKNSAAAFSVVSALLSQKQQITSNFALIPADVATEKDMSGMLLSMVAPLLCIVFLLAGCMSLVPESIAGEKERGAFATMLVTPVKRRAIAFGKIVALSAVSLISGVCSFTGLALSLPKMLQSDETGVSLSVSSYGVTDYLMLFLIIISTVLVIVGLMSVLSTLAKSVKEANSYVGPLMLVVMVATMANMFLGEKIGAWAYFIPVFNSVKAMGDVFAFTYAPWKILATIFSNLAVAAALSFALAKMFDSEKIISGT